MALVEAGHNGEEPPVEGRRQRIVPHPLAPVRRVVRFRARHIHRFREHAARRDGCDEHSKDAFVSHAENFTAACCFVCRRRQSLVCATARSSRWRQSCAARVSLRFFFMLLLLSAFDAGI